MARTTMNIVLSEDLLARIDACAARLGKANGELIQEALYTYVEDIEDGVASDVVLCEEGLKHLLPEGAGNVGLDDRVFETRRKTA